MVKLVPAKCPSCGANIQLPDNLEVGYCTHCGGKVIIDKEQMQVHHTGSVSSLPLCPSCGNTLTEGNRLFECDLCRKKVCIVCSQLNPKESAHFSSARSFGRRIHNDNMSLCRSCALKRLATCTGCDTSENGRWHGQASGICSKCKGRGVTGLIVSKTCTQCHGHGKCPWCGGTGWVKLVQ